MKKNEPEKKRFPIMAAGAAVLAACLVLPAVISRIEKEDVITSAQLEKAIDISQLSTAEFVYNGIAEKYNEEHPERVDCYIAYNASVKVGIQMEDVTFEIQEEEKTVTPVLPDITVQIATLDENSLSYIPKNPDVPLKDMLILCKEDAIREAGESEKLYETAEENLKMVMEALLSPVLENAGTPLYGRLQNDRRMEENYERI